MDAFTFNGFIERKREEQEAIKKLSPHLPRELKDQLPDSTIPDAMSEIRSEVMSFGFDIGNDKFTNLTSGVLGQYNVELDTSEYSATLIAEDNAPDLEKARHVILHENKHRLNRAKSKGIRIIDSLWGEEPLAELATAEHTGQTIAYQTQIDHARDMYYNAGIPINIAVKWYEEGDNKKINDVITASYVKEAKNNLGSETQSIDAVFEATREQAAADGVAIPHKEIAKVIPISRASNPRTHNPPSLNDRTIDRESNGMQQAA